MILLDNDFLNNELDYITLEVNTSAYFKEEWYFIASYICRPKTNRIGLSYDEIDEFIKTGTIQRKPEYISPIKDAEQREKLFKRAMGLQLIYDENNGKNIMQRGSSEDEDVCRETYLALKSIGLIQPIGW